MFRFICVAILLTTGCSIETHAQIALSQVGFEVASVKRNKDAETALLEATRGRFSATCIPLRRLLLIA